MVTIAKTGTIAARRKVMSNLDNKREAADVLFQKVIKAFPVKTSGYIRIISLPRRVGDNAQMARMEWTEKVEYEVKKKPEVKAKGKKVEEKPKKEVKSKK
jgi:large subunit ribosomal protein L17